MSKGRSVLVTFAVLGAVVAGVLLALSGGGSPAPDDAGPGGAAAAGQVPAAEAAVGTEAAAVPDGATPDRAVADLGAGARATGVRGRVVDARTLAPLAGVEVSAMREPPGLERLISRFRGAFLNGGGLWTETARPPDVLGRATTAGDGSFEILGLDPGLVFLDARSDFTFVRTPSQVRLARGEIRTGVELRGSAGGRIRGTVLGADGLPASGTTVSVRPGLNAFLGQLTQRKYRWLEAHTDPDGRFDIPGVPAGSGYTLSAVGPVLALEEVHGVDVLEGQVSIVDIAGHPGARVLGRVLDQDGTPVADANVAMVYLDVSRVLFSADGRSEPVSTDADGIFVLERVAAGRVAFVAAVDGRAPSGIEELAVVDGGDYRDLELVLGEGQSFHGLVVDDAGRPLPDALVELRPMERPRDPDVLKMLLRIRQVETRTGEDGTFVARGLSGDRLFLQVSKAGYVTEIKFGVRLDEQALRIELTRGVTVRGRIARADGQPVERFRVDMRSRPERPARGDGAAAAVEGGGEDASEADRERSGRRGGFDFRMGGGGRGGFGDPMRSGGMRLREGGRIGDRGFGGDWQDFRAADGRFEIRGVPPGDVRVRVRADGYRDPDNRQVVLKPGEESEELAFVLEPGAVARGTVVDADTGVPVADALVSAYRNRDEGERGGGFRFRMDPEDMDFLGLASGGRRSELTDSKGRFEIRGLASGAYRFTARHPDRAKASATDVEIAAEQPTEGIVIELGSGGGIEGTVTGAGKRPLHDALIVAASISAGSFKSSSTDRDGSYRIEGLPPGQYIVFKSRMEEQSSNLGYDLLGNMRLKTVTVRNGKLSRLDIHDESEDGVRVFGTVRDGGQVVARAMVTAIGADSDGLFGMGIRAKPTDQAGNYELIGLKPGSYFFQVTRFAGRPEQASLSIDVPDGLREHRVDLDLPQSSVQGRVIDTSGEPVAGVRVSAGVEEGGMEEAPGLLGLIMKNGVAQATTGADGSFELRRMAAGTYRIAASGSGGRGGRGGRGAASAAGKYGEAAIEGVRVDGTTPVRDLLLTLPLAGRIRGVVVDGSGNPLPGAELHYSRDGEPKKGGSEQIMDLLGVQARPAKSGPDGRFVLQGVSPGTYRVRADAEGLSPGVAEDVVVIEGGQAEVVITVVVGATLRVRVRNVDGEQIPFANLTLLDGEGKPLASKVSVMSVFRRLMSGETKKDDTGWHEVGHVPPDTYTVVVTEKDQPDVRISKEIRDGETVEWDIDLAAELERAGRTRK